MSSYSLGLAAALATAACWAVTSLSFEAAGKRIGSLQVNIIRLAFAIVLFAVLSSLTRGSVVPLDATAELWWWLALSGLVGFVLGDLFLFQAFVDVGARTAMLVFSAVPPLTAVFGWMILGERLVAIQVVAMAITVGGIVLVTSAIEPVAETGGNQVRGVWLAVLGAVGQALGLVLSRYGAPQYDAFAATYIRTIAGLVGFGVVITARGMWKQLLLSFRDRRAMRYVATGSFFGPFLGVSLGLYAAQRAGTGVAATIMATVPVILIPLAVFVLHEQVRVREVLGALLAVGGVAALFFV